MISDLLIILIGFLLLQGAMKTHLAAICPGFLIMISLFIMSYGICMLFNSLSAKFDKVSNFDQQLNYQYDANHPAMH